MTRLPASLASCTAKRPVPPDAPVTSTVSPERISPATSRPTDEVIPPISRGTTLGDGDSTAYTLARSVSTTNDSAKQPIDTTATLLPTENPRAAAVEPAAVTMPTASKPTSKGGDTPGVGVDARKVRADDELRWLQRRWQDDRHNGGAIAKGWRQLVDDDFAHIYYDQ
eukprot:6614138-Prymnesium_polylepis.2